MNIIDFLRVLRANRLVILGCAALGLALGILYSLLQPTLYTATSTAFVTVEGEASISGTETAQTRAQSYIPLINSRTVRERIAAEGLDTADSTMSAALVPNSNLITVSAVAPDAQQAAALAKAASQVAYGGTKDGKVIFDNLCTACHTTGVGMAPTLDHSHWDKRIAQGKDTLYKHAIEGYTGPDGGIMPPKGGNPALTEEQIHATVDWMLGNLK